MNKLYSLITGAALLASVNALAGNSSAASIEQYCFPKSGGLFPADDIWPSVTIVYKAETLTTTLYAATGCETLPSAVANPSSNDAVSFSPTLSESLCEASSVPSLKESLGGPASFDSASRGEVAASRTQSPDALRKSPTSSVAVGDSTIASNGAEKTAVVPGASQTPTTLVSDGLVSRQTTPSGTPESNGSDASGTLASNGGAASGAPTSNVGDASGGTPVSNGGDASGTPVSNVGDTSGGTPVSNGGDASGTPVSNGGDASGTPVSNGGPRSTSIAFGTPQSSNFTGGRSTAVFLSQPSRATTSPSTPPEDGAPQHTSSIDPAKPTQLPGNQTSDVSNTTLQIPPVAVDALQLALFLKNLGVAVFNASSPMNTNTSSLASVIANVSTQENAQHKTLTAMLRRTGSANIAPCKYVLPDNTTDMLLLMSTLKTVEVGVFMSLAESLPTEATTAAILLSSMSSIAAAQNAFLGVYAQPSTRAAPFNTPLSATLAYNLAWKYVQPGSCKVELPIPLLPTLSISDSVVGHARINSTVTFEWDDAARASAARSGKPLFIGWINQVDAPVYTALNAFGDGSGACLVPFSLSGTAFAVLTTQPGLSEAVDLTDATLAGPVVINVM